MKRRNADCGKLRRPFKRNKITEGIYGSTLVYVKFLLVWALVLMADFILQFRFEYLWPFWLLLRSVYDSFKYQGLAFSVFFVCVAVTSDVVCYLFIPVQWLFFCASTYVWVQYVWHTERGICLPTVSLWLLFVYIEASIRLRDIKSFPFNMDLGRPFAAHCIGYPVVTLGFGFKSYISYRFRLRKQKDVEKENEFYIQLLQQALPTELQNIDKQKALPSKSEDSISSNLATTTTSSPQQNGSVPSAKHDKKAPPANTGSGSSGSSHSNSKQHTDSSSSNSSSHHHQHHHHNSSSGSHPDKDLTNNSSSNSHHTGSSNNHNHHNHHSVTKTSSSNKQNNATAPQTQTSQSCIEADAEYIYNSLPPPKKRNVDEFNGEDSLEKDRNERNTAKTSYKQAYGGGGGRNQHNASTTAVSKLNNHKDTNTATATTTTATANTATANTTSSHSTSSSAPRKGKNNNTASVYSNNKEEVIARLETDVKKLKADLQSSRNTEQELRSHINTQTIEEKSSHEELLQLRQDNENLQNKLHNLVTCRQQDKQSLTSLDKKLQEEKKSRAALELQLAQEKKAKKEEAAKAQASRGECSDMCKTRRRDLENDLKLSRRETMIWEDQTRQLERETQTLRQYKEAQNETEVLMSALAAMQDKNAHLENSLSAENRLKQDLFSALGEAKRQIEIHQGLLAQKELDIAELKVKIAEVISLVPTAANFNMANIAAGSQASSPVLQFSGSFTSPSPLSGGAGGAPGSFTPPQGAATFTPPPPSPTEEQEVVANSSLNPNASDYTPKMSQ